MLARLLLKLLIVLLAFLRVLVVGHGDEHLEEINDEFNDL